MRGVFFISGNTTKPYSEALLNPGWGRTIFLCFLFLKGVLAIHPNPIQASAYISVGSQVQIRFLSPKVLFTLETEGQNLLPVI